ncbi:NAD(P)H-hydrate dehydratase [Paenibacillus oleatilyticus]|uniref:NAD(P)H-hydrate dehydratase n=1 Tax=Paenibacillus oleatilyticus TaxID=2594886 RepID=UPI001C1F454E|nr:NAD(P)H-hydrate dehydratase [Paenibacillus oleatilyticus]MBU7316548.1 NAD(P)H-hydrate dehydratase [Paenibacillus oleatilyticus]
MFVVTAEEMRRIDLHTIQTVGIPALVLMENAGRAVAEEGMELFDGRIGALAILAGKGNNGGDGLVAARHLIEAGYDVKIIYAESPESFRGEAAIQRDIAFRLGIPYEVYDSSPIDWRGYSGIIDALLGTGSRGAPREAYAALIEQANLSGLPILSVDLPSGLDADTGQVSDPCIRATRTVALAFTKRGLEQYPGAELAGEVKVRYIGIPQKAAVEAGVRTFRIEEPLLSRQLRLEDYRLRRADSHKGTYGHVLVAAGSRSMSGAGLLSAKAALHGGSGLVTWALPDRLAEPMFGQVPEAMLAGLADEQRGDWSAVHADALAQLAVGKDALLFGPGVGRWAQDTAFLRKLWEGTDCPLVLDADALNMLAAAENAANWPKRGAPVVLTPHPGEMARLTGSTVPAVQRDRIETARRYAARTGVTLVLKGARTVIADPEGNVYINPTGNAGMATGGAGDVLAGIIASLFAQGWHGPEAAALGTYLHGAAGDRAAASRELPASLTAGDIIDHL